MPEPTVPVQVRLSVGVFDAMERMRGELSRQKFVAAAVAVAVMGEKHVPQESKKVAPYQAPGVTMQPAIKTPQEAAEVAARVARPGSTSEPRPFRGGFSKEAQAGRTKKPR